MKKPLTINGLDYYPVDNNFCWWKVYDPENPGVWKDKITLCDLVTEENADCVAKYLYLQKGVGSKTLRNLMKTAGYVLGWKLSKESKEEKQEQRAQEMRDLRTRVFLGWRE